MQRHFSLVLATINRYEELDAFLHSLEMQEYKNFSVILVDQNVDDFFLLPVIERYQSCFELVRIKSEKGLSRARNVGLDYCHGDIICFPDDDCEYPPDLLVRVNELFDKIESDVLIGRQVPLAKDGENKTKLLIDNLKFALRGKKGETIKSLFSDAPSITLFFSSNAIQLTGKFDQSLGAGAGTPWGSGEDTDYVLRAYLRGCSVMRSPDIWVYHPDILYSRDLLPKARAYGRGRGRVLHKYNLGFFFCMQNIFYPLVRGLCLLPNIAAFRYHIAMAWGRMEGLFLQRDRDARL